MSRKIEVAVATATGETVFRTGTAVAAAFMMGRAGFAFSGTGGFLVKEEPCASGFATTLSEAAVAPAPVEPVALSASVDAGVVVAVVVEVWLLCREGEGTAALVLEAAACGKSEGVAFSVGSSRCVAIIIAGVVLDAAGETVVAGMKVVVVPSADRVRLR